MKTKTTLILSGGMDSTTLLYHLLDHGHAVECVGVDYGQRHKKELACAERVCRDLGLWFEVIDLSSVGRLLTGSSQTDLRVPVPEGHYAAENMKLTVVPNRNMLMLAAAGAVAVCRKSDVLAYGAHSGDHTIYPDCRPEFVQAMGLAFGLCDWHKLSLEAPFMHMDKGDICKIGVSLKVPFEHTWTCYAGREVPCGKCGACQERAEAFGKAGVQDPLLAAADAGG